MSEDRIQCRPVEPAEVLNPTAQDWIPHARQVIDGLVAPQMEMQLRISWRIFFAASRLTAGVKLMKHLPHRFFDCRGRNVYPRKLNFSWG